MAKGSSSKELITEVLLGVFKGSFVNGKEIRIPVLENGEAIQIKVTLTAAKDLISADGSDTISVAQFSEPTEEEKETIRQLLAKMGIE